MAMCSCRRASGEPGLYDGLPTGGLPVAWRQPRHRRRAVGIRAAAGKRASSSPTCGTCNRRTRRRRTDAIDAHAGVCRRSPWNGGSTRLQGNVPRERRERRHNIGQRGRRLARRIDGRRALHASLRHLSASSPASRGAISRSTTTSRVSYYRLAYQSLRWQIDGGIDQVNSVSGQRRQRDLRHAQRTLPGSRSRFGFGGQRDLDAYTPARIRGWRRVSPTMRGRWALSRLLVQRSDATTARSTAMPSRSASIIRGTCRSARVSRRRSPRLVTRARAPFRGS